MSVLNDLSLIEDVETVFFDTYFRYMNTDFERYAEPARITGVKIREISFYEKDKNTDDISLKEQEVEPCFIVQYSDGGEYAFPIVPDKEEKDFYWIGTLSDLINSFIQKYED